MKRSNKQLKIQVDLLLKANNQINDFLEMYIDHYKERLHDDELNNFNNIIQHLTNLNKFFLTVKARF